MGAGAFLMGKSNLLVEVRNDDHLLYRKESWAFLTLISSSQAEMLHKVGNQKPSAARGHGTELAAAAAAEQRSSLIYLFRGAL